MRMSSLASRPAGRLGVVPVRTPVAAHPRSDGGVAPRSAAFGYDAGPPIPPKLQEPQPGPQPSWQQQQQQRQPTASPGYQGGAYTSQPAQPASAQAVTGNQDGLEGIRRVNPKWQTVNKVTLLGIVAEATGLSGRSSHATLMVPFSTKPGFQSFTLEAWDDLAGALQQMNGMKVLVEGRLSQDARGDSSGVKVVASGIQLVDPTLEPTASIRKGYGGEATGSSRSKKPDPQEIWRVHYETQTRSPKELAAQLNCTAKDVFAGLLVYAAKSQSPLHWKPLAEELGLSTGEGQLSLMDMMGVVNAYKAEVGTNGPLPVTKDGMLRVRPIRDWALAKEKDSAHHYAVVAFEERRSLEDLYEALRLAAVAEATSGAWDYDAEFS